VAAHPLAAVLAGFSLAADLGHGRQLEHSVRVAALAGRLARRAGLGPDDRRDVLFVGLLQATGCVGNAHDTAAAIGDDVAFKSDIVRANFIGPAAQVRAVVRHAGRDTPLPARVARLASALDPGKAKDGMRAHCETAALIAGRCGLGERVRAALMASLERWDGRGGPAGLRGDSIPLAARAVAVATAAEVFHALGGPPLATERVRAASGAALDPALATAFLDEAADERVWGHLDAPGLWDDVIASEPAPRTLVDNDGLDAIAVAFADFADVKSPWFAGHSRGVAELAAVAARLLHLGEDEVTVIRRAGLVHDVGRATVPNSILDAPRALTPGERERIRLHAYYTERVMGRAAGFADCALAGAHHERVDGSGYPRAERGSGLGLGARILAAADAFQAMTEDRPYRSRRTAEGAAAALREEARAGRFDAQVVEAVVGATSGAVPRGSRASSDLTERELEVVRLLPRGGTNKEMARALGISENTLRHHLESVYAKLDVMTRTAALMQALGRGLL
jgi:HD-GYP domain-containing protein (c-di-GMP phosphodiesterase class II)